MTEDTHTIAAGQLRADDVSHTLGEWISWPGGARPVGRDVHVAVRFRDGCEAGSHHPAHFFDVLWRHEGMHRDNDIVAYRIVTKAQGLSPEREAS